MHCRKQCWAHLWVCWNFDHFIFTVTNIYFDFSTRKTVTEHAENFWELTDVGRCYVWYPVDGTFRCIVLKEWNFSCVSSNTIYIYTFDNACLLDIFYLYFYKNMKLHWNWRYRQEISFLGWYNWNLKHLKWFFLEFMNWSEVLVYLCPGFIEWYLK